jgi:predicted O-linked N-acetylglucosamine transferase (SPINDLY family)
MAAATDDAEPRGQSARDLWFARGRAHMAAGAPAEAAIAFRRMLAAAPDDPIAALSLGSALIASNGLLEAEAVLRNAVTIRADFAGGWANLAVALAGLQRLDEALDCARRAVALAPKSVAACQVFTAVAIQSGNAAQAVPICRAALAAAPDNPMLVAALADALKGSGEREEAMALLAPLAAAPHPAPSVLVSYGALCVEGGRHAEARDALTQAIVLDPRNPRAFDNLGTAQRRLGNLEQARDAYARAVALDGTLTPALCNLIDVLRILCDWDALPGVEAQRQTDIERPLRDARWNPFVALRDEVTAREQQQIARAWSRSTLPPIAPLAPPLVRSRGARLRVGYLSSDLQEHATARLMAGLFERHDKARIESFAYSYGRDDGSAMRARLLRAFDHWRDVGGSDDAVAARRIRDNGIDVLVELKGHTQGSRLGILCHRAATVQIHYLGYPGTLGFAGVSHLVADAITVPPGQEAHYDETILRMPHAYQVNDDRRALPPATPRHALGLRDDAIVLACFNPTYKLSRKFLEIWIAAMQDAPRAVLWLYAPDATARANLVREATTLGLDSARIVFAPTVDNEAHIARLRAADLALDVLPCGSHTTGSDALWAGVPMLSCVGETFAGRVGASLLAAADLSELTTATPQAYLTMLRDLLREPDRLREYKLALERKRAKLPLFATESFTRAFERLLERAINHAR